MTKKKRRRAQPARSTGGSRQREAAARARAAAASREEVPEARAADDPAADPVSQTDTAAAGAVDALAPVEAGVEPEPDSGAEPEPEPEPPDSEEPSPEDASEEERPAARPTLRATRPTGSRPVTRSGDRTRDRAPTQAPTGLFGGLRAPSPYPLFRETMVRAVAVVASSPILVVLPLLLVLALWLLLLAVGLDHVPLGFMDILAIPPIGSFFDLNIAGTVSPQGAASIVLLFGMTILRAVIIAVLVALIVEHLDGNRPSSLTLARALRAIPATLAYCAGSLVVIYVAQYVSIVLGSLGNLVSILGFVGALYFLVFVPIAALHGYVPFREALRRSVAAARLPGSRHVALVMIYFFILIVPLLYALQAPGPFSANPSIEEWVIVLGMTLLHVMFLTAFVYRYLAVADQIPEAPPPRQSRQARTPRGDRTARTVRTARRGR